MMNPLNSTMLADKIVVMQQGKVEGTHDELLAQSGHYFGMWEQQFPMIRQLSHQ
jgi:ABC-type multidrug transport system fused ATPase/permease subunit